MNHRPLIHLTLVLLLLTAAGVFTAQAQDCGSGLPCGPLPWSQLRLPLILTPTTIIIPTGIPPTAAPGSTAVPNPTNAPPSGPLPTTGFDAFDAGPLRDQMATIQAVISNNTPLTINDANGAPINLNDVANVSSGGTTLIGYIKGLTYLNIGFLTPLIQLLILRFTLTITVFILAFIVPLAATLIGVIRKAITVVVEFLPL